MLPALRTFAYCCASQRWAVARAAGVEPLTSPPMHFEVFDSGLLKNRQLLYFALHGLPDQPYWYGDDYLTAMSIDALTGLSLRKTVVFVANCHFTAGPFLDALRALNPRALIAGSGENFGRSQTLVGCHRLGYYLRLGLQTGLPPRLSLTAAKLRLRTHNEKLKAYSKYKDTRLDEDVAANVDALSFEEFA